MTFYPKTFVMNVVLAIGASAMGIALYQQKSETTENGFLQAIFWLYVTVVLLFTLSAYALTYRATPRLHTPTMWANAIIALLVVFSIALSASFLNAPVALKLFGGLLYALPLGINALALHEFSKNSRAIVTLEKSSSTSRTESGKMKIRIIDRSTQKQIYIAELFLQAQNYEPKAEEYFDLAWKAAVEDGAASESDRKKYMFMVAGEA